MSVWNTENVKDVAESIGITSLSDDVLQGLTADIEYRIAQVLEEGLKFMRHGKRSVFSTQDVSQALRVLGVEPLYGYESTRPLRFGEATIGPGQSLFYVEDEEVDFEKLINAPLPKIPRDVSFTAHWLAVEGVQPSIPQNPTSAESRNQELLPRGSNANPTLAAMSGSDSVAVKPLVKHVLSQELQRYFDKVCSALMDESNNEYRAAALASVASDPGLHQLVPYFVQFIAEKVTHNLENLFVLEQTMQLASAMLDNTSLFIDPYVASLVPPILTTLLARHLGPRSPPPPSQGQLPTYPLRRLSASLLRTISTRYAKASTTLKPRLARTCLKHFLDPSKPLATTYGATVGLAAVGGAEVVRGVVVPNLKAVDEFVLKDLLGPNAPAGGPAAAAAAQAGQPVPGSMLEGSNAEGPAAVKRKEGEMLVQALMASLKMVEEADARASSTAGAAGAGGRDKDTTMNGHTADMRETLTEKIGGVLAERVVETGRAGLVRAVLDC